MLGETRMGWGLVRPAAHIYFFLNILVPHCYIVLYAGLALTINVFYFSTSLIVVGYLIQNSVLNL